MVISKALNLIEKEYKLHPYAQLVDYCKLLYQSIFGATHFTNNEQKIIAEIEKELEFTVDSSEPILSLEITKKFYRFPLYIVKQNRNILPFFSKAFYESSLHHNTLNRTDWQDIWYQIQQKLLDSEISSHFDLDCTEKFVTDLKHGRKLLHHSTIYHEHYQPHYRIIDESGLQILLQKNSNIQNYIQ